MILVPEFAGYLNHDQITPLAAFGFLRRVKDNQTHVTFIWLEASNYRRFVGVPG
jgi:hypothetical protein